jgi:hypothetical protein
MKKMTMARSSLAALGLVCVGALGAFGLSPRPAIAADEPYAGVEILRGLFVSYDYNHDGRITPREFNAFTQVAFVSMDTDADGRVSREEFVAWDPGFAYLAEQRGKEEPFNAAKREAFRAWDVTVTECSTRQPGRVCGRLSDPRHDRTGTALIPTTVAAGQREIRSDTRSAAAEGGC